MKKLVNTDEAAPCKFTSYILPSVSLESIIDKQTDPAYKC